MITAPQRTISIDLPKKLGFLLELHPYKVAYGGRFGLKSWSFAEALLALGAAQRLRILCAREYQNSIDESVHQLLKQPDREARSRRLLPRRQDRDRRRQRHQLQLRGPGRAHGRFDQVLRRRRHPVGRGGAEGLEALVGHRDPDHPRGEQRDLGDLQPGHGHRRHLPALGREPAARREGGQDGLAGRPGLRLVPREGEREAAALQAHAAQRLRQHLGGHPALDRRRRHLRQGDRRDDPRQPDPRRALRSAPAGPHGLGSRLERQDGRDHVPEAAARHRQRDQLLRGQLPPLRRGRGRPRHPGLPLGHRLAAARRREPQSADRQEPEEDTSRSSAASGSRSSAAASGPTPSAASTRCA
jgi:hypothetical protein